MNEESTFNFKGQITRVRTEVFAQFCTIGLGRPLIVDLDEPRFESSDVFQPRNLAMILAKHQNVTVRIGASTHSPWLSAVVMHAGNVEIDPKGSLTFFNLIDGQPAYLPENAGKNLKQINPEFPPDLIACNTLKALQESAATSVAEKAGVDLSIAEDWFNLGREVRAKELVSLGLATCVKSSMRKEALV